MSTFLALFLQSSVSHDYDLLFWGLVALCGTVAIGIAIFLIYSVWRYRRRDANELPDQTALNIPAEVTWIVIPFVLFMCMFFIGAKLYFKIERPPENAEDVYVVAKQWMWKTQHLDGQREINSLHIPVGQPIRLNMISQDVIHSFYVPAFRIKQDVLPRRYTIIWFKAEKPGKYHLFCAEYCGTNHSQMTGWIYALNPKDYKTWLEQGGAEGSLASTGEKLFHQFACSNCHHFSGHGRAPNLIGLYNQPVQISGGQVVTADDSYLRESILDPKAKIVEGFQPLMPTFQGQLSEDDVIALIAYIKALGPESSGAPSSADSDQVSRQHAASPPASSGSTQAPNKSNPGVR